MNPKCASGHLWSSWRQPTRRDTAFNGGTFFLSVPYKLPPYTVCLRTGCDARMDLEETRVAATPAARR